MTAFAMILFMGIAALAVDIAILQQARIRAQATADSAALAAVQDLDNISLATTAAQDYASRNFNVAIGDWSGCTDPQPLPESTGVNCISVDTASSLKLVRVRLPNRQVATFFAPLLGVNAFSVSATATAEVEFTGGSPGIPTDGDADPADFQQIADFVRAGDPGNGYAACGTLPTWLDTSQPQPDKWAEYILVFEHLNGSTTTVCGTTSDVTVDPFTGKTKQWGMDTWLANVGGNMAPTTSSMFIHVSCSQNFIAQDGWHAEKDGKLPKPGQGPLKGIDTEWHIVQYIGARYQANKKTGEVSIKNACGYSFTPLTSDPTPATPNIRLSN